MITRDEISYQLGNLTGRMTAPATSERYISKEEAAQELFSLGVQIVDYVANISAEHEAYRNVLATIKELATFDPRDVPTEAD